jgi:hypothetical protein
MDMDDFFALIQKMRVRDLEEKTWELYIHLKPHIPDLDYEEMIQNAKGEEPEGVYIDQVLL